jgi:hypothetical protein
MGAARNVGIIGTRNMEALAKFHIEVARTLSWALESGVLSEGRYCSRISTTRPSNTR